MIKVESIIVGEDSLENANKARMSINESFPEVEFSIISDLEEILSIAANNIQENNVLVRMVIPEGGSVCTVDLMRIWSASLNGAD
jgi:hypothetical protein